MSRERKRKAKESIEKGIPIAEPGAEIIFNDPVLKSPFISNPFMSRLKGRAFLEQMLAYNLYFDDLTKKWKPLSDITISTVKNLGRYYPTNPTPPSILSDLPMRINAEQHLMVQDQNVYITVAGISSKLDNIYTETVFGVVELEKLNKFNSGYEVRGSYTGTNSERKLFPAIGIPYTCVDILLDVTVIGLYVSIRLSLAGGNSFEVFSEFFNTIGYFKRRIIVVSAYNTEVGIYGSQPSTEVYYYIHGSYLPFETEILT